MEVKIQKIKIEGKLWLRLMKPTERKGTLVERIATVISLRLMGADGIMAISRNNKTKSRGIMKSVVRGDLRRISGNFLERKSFPLRTR